MDSNRNGQHALLTAAAGVTLAAGAFALVRSSSRQRLQTLEDADRLQWLTSEDVSSLTARRLLQLDKRVRTLRLQSDAEPSLKRVSSFKRFTGRLITLAPSDHTFMRCSWLLCSRWNTSWV